MDVQQFLKEKKKIVFIVLGLLLILIATISYLKKDKKSDKDPFVSVNTEIPAIEGNDVFKKKSDAYDQAKKDSLFKARNKSNANFDLYSFGGENDAPTKMNKQESNDMDFRIDSVLNANRMTYDEKGGKPKKKYTSSKNYSTPKTTRASSTVASNDQSNEDVQNQFNTLFNKRKKESGTKTSHIQNSNRIEVKAVINGNQEVANGGRVEMRLLEPFQHNGMLFEKNTIFYGIASFKKNRVGVKISTIKHNQVDFLTYDEEDGMLGIHTKYQNILGEVKDKSSDEAIEGSGETSSGIANGIKNILKSRKKKEDIKIPLLNNTTIRLKMN